MSDCLLEKRPDGVALITLNRPESLNALGGDLVPLLAQHLDDCESDPAVRCIALTGAGRAFCAGGDVRNMQRRNEGQQVEHEAAQVADPMATLDTQVRELRARQNGTSLRLHTIPMPTVAIVNGHAMGAGMSIALACDIRLCGPAAKFGTAFRNVGLSGDFGGTYYLQRLVGAGRARELYFTAEILDSQRALELGIANRVYEGDSWFEDALVFCSKLAAGPAGAIARMKANLNFTETAALQPLLDHEALNMRISGMSADSREAVQAFLEKREPHFGHL